jgi:hypothetical protein
LGRDLVWLKGSLGTEPPWGIRRKPMRHQAKCKDTTGHHAVRSWMYISGM